MPLRHFSPTDPRKEGGLLSKPRPVIVASVVDAAGLRRVLRAKRPTWDAVELRLDRIGFGVDVRRSARALKSRGLPVIATIRAADEGGAWRGDSEEREKKYRSFMSVVTAIDVELRSDLFPGLVHLAHSNRVAVIGSFHDFESTPTAAFLANLAEKGWRGGADIVKMATTVKKPRDLKTLKGLLRRFAGQKVCVIGMGDSTSEVRIELARAGSFLAYGSVGRPAAPGQIPCSALRKKLERS